MGVHGLWDLLAPAGRRVSVETLAGKRLAIDASIWMVQFMKAMRDEKGEMIRNAHLLGFFRRICKLLFLRARPVFVFDGATPAIKRRTVMSRRRNRENAQAKVRKTAEKLLLNHLKTMRLKELADDIKNQRQSQKSDEKGAKLGSVSDEMLPPPVLAEKDGSIDAAAAAMLSDDEGTILPDILRSNLETNDMASNSCNQQKLDELLAASLMEEERRGFSNNASTSNASLIVEDEDDDEDEEMIVPDMDCGVDPSILASLPPSMQLDLLVQIRERLMAENRQKYQQVKKDPGKFSELQIQAYLKTVAFRREIDQVQKTASGRGVGGVQTSRIASEANREFIFSTSFTGDQRELASGRAEKHGDKSKSTSGSEGHPIAMHTAASTSKSKPETVSKVNGERRVFDDDIETYVDDRGRVRVSRVRAMGIHMTRDLQRNLDLMKEIEQEREIVDSLESQSQTQSQRVDLTDKTATETSFDGLESISRIDVDEDSISKSDATLQISFEHDGDTKCLDDDDDIFIRLAAENPITLSSDDFTPLKKLSSPSYSDCEWEEGNMEETTNGILTDDVPFPKGNPCDDSEVEWEEGVCEIMETTASTVAETRKAMSKGYLEEQADLQEAIKRSLEKSRDSISALPGENTHAGSRVLDREDTKEEQTVLGAVGIEKNTSTSGTFCDLGVLGVSKTDDSVSLENLDDKQPAYPVSQLNLEDRKEEPIFSADDGIKQHPSTSETVSDNPKHFKVSCVDVTDASNAGDLRTSVETEPSCPVVKMASSDAPLSEELMNELICDIDMEEKLAAKEGSENDLREIDDMSENSAFKENEGFQENLDEELRVLQEERIDLGDDRRRLERNADSVSSEMYMECQELLQMFGIPFIIAPMEAEAQCAFMEQANLVDGVVTDDSDVFLFGARSVYKNIFDDRKYVETYFMKDIETEIGLSREKLIRMALLLGSDYTEGVSGIGIVNAIEVLTAFPEENGLQEFRDWIDSPDPSILGNFGSQTENFSEADQIQDRRKIFMDKHRKLSKNWHIPSSFPSDTVISAYLSPEVDKSTETFTWGKPDHFVLRKLCWEKFGWANQKADDLIVPVLKEYGKHETQRRLEEFYTFNERFAKIRSKRIKKAVKGITGKQSLEQTVDGAPQVSGRKKRKQSMRSESENDQSETVDSTKKSTPKRDTQSRRGRGRGKASGRRKRKESPSSEPSEVRSSDDEDEEINTEKQDIPETLRRSMRSRKQVDYTVNDMDTDDLDQSADKDDKQLFDEEPPKQDDPRENAAWGLGRESRCSPKNASPKQASETDYLEQGGGFCPENDDNDPPNPKENFENGGGFCTDGYDNGDGGFCPENNEHDPLNPNETFQNGGGFCTDEDRNDQVVNTLGEVSELDNETPANSVVTHLKPCSSGRETETNSGPTIPVGSLRSMPHLRRKRRRT